MKIYIIISTAILVSFILGYSLALNTGEYQAYKKIHDGNNLSLKEYETLLGEHSNLNNKIEAMNTALSEENLLTGALALNIYNSLEKGEIDKAKEKAKFVDFKNANNGPDIEGATALALLLKAKNSPLKKGVYLKEGGLKPGDVKLLNKINNDYLSGTGIPPIGGGL